MPSLRTIKKHFPQILDAADVMIICCCNMWLSVGILSNKMLKENNNLLGYSAVAGEGIGMDKTFVLVKMATGRPAAGGGR